MTSLAPHGGDALGATPGHPLLTPALSGARDLSMSRQQALLDLQAIQRIPGLAGYWPADPAYLFEDSAGTIPASVGGVVGLITPLGYPTTFGPELADTLNTVAAWTADGANTVIEEDGATKVTYVDGSFGAHSLLSAANGLNADLEVGAAYLLTGQAKISSGVAVPNVVNSAWTSVSQGAFTLNSTDYVNFSIAFNATHATTNRIFVNGMSAGETVWIKSLSIKKLVTPSAIQSTTANKPYLRRTPTSGVYWLDSNTSTSALTATLGNLGSSCTVASATAEGVTFTENVTISSTYNIAPASGFNSDIAIFNRALTTTEKALVTRYMQRGVPVLGANVIPNGTFDANTTGWTPTTSTTLVATGGRGVITNAGATNRFARALSTLTIGKAYYGTCSAISDGTTRPQIGFGATLITSGDIVAVTDQTLRVAGQTATADVYIFSLGADTKWVSYDNIVVREIL